MKQTIYYNNGDRHLLELAIKNNENILLEGESGTGKTSMIKAIADEMGKKLIRINLNGQTGVEDIIGYKTANNGTVSFVYGALVQAMKNGDWIVFDELNAGNPEVLFVLQSLLDDDKSVFIKEWNNEKVTAHPEFRFFATQNPPTNYAGTKELNSATLSRFGCVLSVDYSEKEAQILKERTGVESSMCEGLVVCANAIREMNKKGEITAICTTRDLLQVCKLISLGVDALDAIEVAIVNKAGVEQREELKKIFELNLNVRFKLKINGKNVALTGKEAQEVEERINDAYKKLDTIKKDLDKAIEESEKATEQSVNDILSSLQSQVIQLIEDSEETKPMKEKLQKAIVDILNLDK